GPLRGRPTARPSFLLPTEMGISIFLSKLLTRPHLKSLSVGQKTSLPLGSAQTVRGSCTPVAAPLSLGRAPRPRSCVYPFPADPPNWCWKLRTRNTLRALNPLQARPHLPNAA